MGCGPLICGKQTYSYIKEQKLLNKVMSEFSHLAQCYSHDFVINCHKNILLNPEAFLLKYEKKIEQKQIVPHTILEKWKLILYGTNVDNEHYADCIGFDKHFEEQRISSKTYRFSKRNPFQIRLQDLYFHESYRQIQKDAGRVYLVPQIKQDLFQKLLKKIANHFPESGYSLGINYIIGYFLLVGMSEMDSFWMFVHLTLNQKFLALGFFENDLPLTKVIIEIFKNILRRKNKELYEYIYKHLEVDDTSWILKWFTSFFLSTFPIQFCHYVLDFIFSFGVLGLAVVAFAIVNFFQYKIYKCEEATDFFITLQQLFSFEYFSQEVHIQQFMSSIYDVSLNERDFDLLGEIGDNFYVKYFVLFSEWNFKHSTEAREKMNELLSGWYLENKTKRETFTNKMSKSFEGKFFTENKEDEPKMGEIQEEKNQKMQVTKDQKMEEKTYEQIQVSPDVEKKDQNKLSQNPSSSHEKARTIKISSKNIKFHVKSSSFENQNESQNQAFEIEYSKKKRDMTERPKSEKAFSYKKKLMKKIRSERRIGYINQGHEKSKNQNITSIKSFVIEDNLNEGEVSFHFNPLSKEFSQKDYLSKTLPLKKRSQNFGSLNLLEVKNQNYQSSKKEIKIKENQNLQINNLENQSLEKEKQEQKIKETGLKDDELERIWNEEAGHEINVEPNELKETKQKIEEQKKEQNIKPEQNKITEKIQLREQNEKNKKSLSIDVIEDTQKTQKTENFNNHNQIQTVPFTNQRVTESEQKVQIFQPPGINTNGLQNTENQINSVEKPQIQ